MMITENMSIIQCFLLLEGSKNERLHTELYIQLQVIYLIAAEEQQAKKKKKM